MDQGPHTVTMCMPTPSNVSGFGYSWGFASSADLSKGEVETPSSLSYTLGNTVSPETTLTVMSHKSPQVQDKIGVSAPPGTRLVTTTTGPGGQRRTMFLVNESPNHGRHSTQQNHATATIQATNISSKFMSPIGPIQLTAEECNEILMKRALQAQGIATPVIDASQINHAILNGDIITGLKGLNESGQATETIQTTTVQHHHLINAKQEPGTANSSPKVQEMEDVQTAYSQTDMMGGQVGGIQGQQKERPYSCDECGKSFLLKHHLTTHARVHTGERPHVCVHCGKSFAHKHCLNTHLLLHSTDRPFQCHECKKSFTLKHHLLTHSRVHSRDRPFVCGDCGRGFPLKRHLVTHSKYHAGERPFVCSECGESFAQKDHLVMHSRFHGALSPFVCPECGASFARKFQLVNHGRVHGRVPHACPVCAKEFLQKRTLVTHMKLHTGEGVVACLECGEAFKSKSELQQHFKMTRHCTPQSPPLPQPQQQQQPQHQHTITKMDDFKPQILQVIGSDGQVISEKATTGYACTECGSCFNTKEALALHVRLHSGDRTCVTDLCALTAGLQSAGLVTTTQQPQQHQQQQQHQSTQQNQIQIIAASPSNNLIQHAQVRHSDMTIVPMVTPRPKVHFCGDCGKGFAAKHGLQQHNRRHPDGGCTLRTHVCDTCGKAFFQKNHLMLHQRQHMDLPSRNAHHNQAQQTQQQPQQAQQQQHQAPPDPLAIDEHQQSTHIQVVTNRSGQVIGNQILVGGLNARRQIIGSQVHIIGRDGKTIGTQVTHGSKDRHHTTSGEVKDVGGLVLATSRAGLIKYEISIPNTSVVQVQNID